MARECEAASRKTRIQTQGNERALLSWCVGWEWDEGWMDGGPRHPTLLNTYLHDIPPPPRFFSRLQTEDPDVVVGHNLLGFELEVLLARATALKVRR